MDEINAALQAAVSRLTEIILRGPQNFKSKGPQVLVYSIMFWESPGNSDEPNFQTQANTHTLVLCKHLCNYVSSSKKKYVMWFLPTQILLLW